MFGKLICFVMGHKRGRRIPYRQNADSIDYACPRCGATWARRAKPKKTA